VRFLFGSHDGAHQEEYRLRDLLPDRFGPIDLLEPGSAPLLLEPQDNALEWGAAANRRLEERGAGDGVFARAAAAALEAARRVRARGGGHRAALGEERGGRLAVCMFSQNRTLDSALLTLL
jgi:hypothetical protein